MSKKLNQSTLVVHAGLKKAKDGQPFMQGPTFASAFHLSGDVNDEKHQYARFHNPTWDALENAISELEQGPVLIFPSGMAAAAAIMTAVLESGDTVLLASDGYPTTRAYADDILGKFGVKVRSVATSQIPNESLTNVKLVFIETPSNPMLDVIDIQKLSQKVHSHGGLLAIDNTTLTPLGQQPLLLGADISMCSDTKAMNGHSDVVFGHAASNNAEIFESLLRWRKLSGSIPGPMETWLLHRGLASLDMRLERMVNNAQHIAEYLYQHEKIKSIRYPGLKTDPSYVLACQQMNHFGFVISFDLGTKQAAESFLKNTELIYEATSFGGMHTMAERRARWGADELSPGLIRLSVGCENLQDILNDFTQALDSI